MSLKNKYEKTEDELIRNSSQEVILETAGVHSLSSKGVKIEHQGESIVINAYLNVDYGCRIPELAWNIQKNIKDAVVGITKYKLKKININIQGVK